MTTMMSARTAYVLRDVGFTYSTEREGSAAWSLSGISCEIREGEILGLLGPNGSGKTSLLKLLGKMLLPQHGAIELFGRGLRTMSQIEVARCVAFVPQEQQQIFPFTIMETVLMGRFPHRAHRPSLGGFEQPADVEVARAAMRQMDVETLAERSIQDVSSGERQRAMIARALAQDPRILLLDEPTSFLDLSHQVEICRILRMLNEERRLTVVLVSHDLTLAGQYCDRLLLMEKGRVFRIGTPDEVIRPEVLERVFQCSVLVDRHPESGLPRVTLPARPRVTSRPTVH